jgi:hypothetical protein
VIATGTPAPPADFPRTKKPKKKKFKKPVATLGAKEYDPFLFKETPKGSNDEKAHTCVVNRVWNRDRRLQSATVRNAYRRNDHAQLRELPPVRDFPLRTDGTLEARG